MAFHDRLKQARIKAGLTQAQAANAIGIAKSTYSGYETGKSEPSMNVIANLMRIFEVAPDFLWQDEMRAQFKRLYLIKIPIRMNTLRTLMMKSNYSALTGRLFQAQNKLF